MKRYSIPVMLLALFMWMGCGKSNNYPTIPDLKYNSIYPHDLSTADSVAITCSFKDKEGDIQNAIWYKVYNITTPEHTTEFDDYRHDVPNFPAQRNMEGTIITILKPGVDFSVGTAQGGGSDSVYFELFLKDAAGHISDTIRTDTVLVHTI